MRRSADQLLPASLLTVLLGWSAAPVVAQDLPPARQLELATGLAREFGFVDMAQRLVDDLRQQPGVNEEQLAFVISTLLRDAIASSAPGVTSSDAAERGVAYGQRMAAYNRAIDAYDLYLADQNRRYQRSDAARDMLRVVREKLDITLFWLETDSDQSEAVVKTLIDSAIEREVSGSKRWQMAVRHAESETGAIESKVEALYDQMGANPDQDQELIQQIEELEAQLARIQFEKGEIYLSQYKLLTKGDPNAKDAKDFLDVAVRTFREIADTQGDSSNAGLYATARQAECYLYAGRVKDSLRYFTRVFDAAVPRPKLEPGVEFDPLSLEPLNELWKLARDDQNFTPAEFQGYLRGRRLPMCQAYETAIRLFRTKSYLPEAEDIATQFLQERKRWKLGTESGESALRELGNFDAAFRATLEAGIVLSLAGQTGAAIELTWTVAHANLDPLSVRPLNLLGRKAIDAIRQIASHVEEGQLNAEQFRAAAISAYLDKDYRAATALFRKALKRFGETRLGGELVVAETFLVICYQHLSLCFTFLNDGGEPRRHLAAMAARNAALNFFEEDERYAGEQSPRCQVTKNYRGLVTKLETEDPASVKLCERWKDEASVLATLRCNEGEVEFAISEGSKRMNADRYEAAITELERVVDVEHRSYFQAQALLGRCHYEIAARLESAGGNEAKARAEYEKATQQMAKALSGLEQRKEDEKKKGRVFSATRESAYTEQAHYYSARSYRALIELAKEEEKNGLRQKAVDEFREAATEPWDNAQLGNLSLSLGIPMLVELGKIDEAKAWFARLDESVAGTDPRYLVTPALALYKALKPEASADTDLGLEPRYDAATYEQFKQAAHYFGRMNAGTKPSFNNRWIEARYLTEIAKTGAPGVAEAALEKWTALAGEPEAAEQGHFVVPIARTRMLIGGLENFRLAAEIFSARCFYAYTRGPKGEQDWSAAPGWNASRRKMTIKFGDVSEAEYLLDKVSFDDLSLCAIAHAGGLAPNLREVGKDPIAIAGLGELLHKANPSAKAEIARLVRAHQVGKEVWGYLLNLEKRTGTEAYLALHLNYFYTKALLSKTLEPNRNDTDETRAQLRTFKNISNAGDEWENFPTGYKTVDKDATEIPDDRKKAWRAAYRWLDRFIGS